jgi:adenylyltransferase/sulfurtransferase
MGFFSKLFGGSKPTAAAGGPAATPRPAAPTPKFEGGGGVPQELAASEVEVLYNSSNRPVFLDVREEHERQAEGFIPGSVHIPMDQLPDRLGELDPAAPLVVYCASGMRSMDAGAFLLEKGFRDVSNLNGGMMKWAGPRERPAR